MLNPRQQTAPSAELPPGPRDSFFGLLIGYRLSRKPLDFLASLRGQGDLVGLRIAGIRAVLVNEPELIADVLIRNADRIQKLPHQKKVLSQIEGHGLLVSEGDAWRHQRRMLQPAFNANQMQWYADVTREHTEALLQSWSCGQEIDAVETMTDLAMTSMAHAFYGIQLNEDVGRLRVIVRDLSDAFLREMRVMMVFPRWLPYPMTRRKFAAIDALNELIWGIIRSEEGATSGPTNLLSLLLQAKNHPDPEQRITESQARDEAVTMFNSGHDTTAAGLVWILYLLAKHPEVAARVQEEAQQVLGKSPITVDAIERLDYTNMVINEAMRLYPPGWSLFTRQATAAFKLGSYAVQPGDWLMIFPWVTHRDPRYFKDPDTFDPLRFSPERAGEIQRHAFFPFSIGPHSCIGVRLAKMQMSLTVAMISQRFRFSLVDPDKAVKAKALLSIWPKGGLKLRIESIQATPESQHATQPAG